MIRVKVFSEHSPFGMSVYIVDNMDDVTVDEFGTLRVQLPPREQTTASMGTVTKIIPALNSSRVLFPKGMYTKVIIEDVVTE